MTLSDELDQIQTVFIDTAPIIYYIEESKVIVLKDYL
jgi:hypothetical protein